MEAAGGSSASAACSLGSTVSAARVSAAGSAYLRRTIGEGIHWQRFDPGELGYVAAVVALAFLAGLVPALAAYRTPVATNLVAA